MVFSSKLFLIFRRWQEWQRIWSTQDIKLFWPFNWVSVPCKIIPDISKLCVMHRPFGVCSWKDSTILVQTPEGLSLWCTLEKSAKIFNAPLYLVVQMFIIKDCQGNLLKYWNTVMNFVVYKQQQHFWHIDFFNPCYFNFILFFPFLPPITISWFHEPLATYRQHWLGEGSGVLWMIYSVAEKEVLFYT